MKYALLLLAATFAFGQEHIDLRIEIANASGIKQHPLAPPAGKLAALFFVNTDCPVSNYYAREIRRICTLNAGRITCYLVYTDPTVGTDAVAKHKADFGHGDYPAILDTNHALVKATGATVTPEVALVDSSGSLQYRGRIDNTFVTAGRKRASVTERNLLTAIDSALSGTPIGEPRTKASGCFITPIELLKPVLSKPGPQ